MSKFVQFLVCLFCLLSTGRMVAQPPRLSKLITVRDGLPQSYVSGIVQGKNGFLWIATLNGFCRYDGRGFKQYWHSPADTAGLSSNIILHLLDAGNQQLLLCHMDGRMDLFDTESEKVRHLGNQPAFNRLKNESGCFKSLVSNNKGLCWMIAGDGGINQIDIHRNTLEHFTPAQLMLQEPLIGLAIQKEKFFLLTQTHLSIRTTMTGFAQTISCPFKIANLPVLVPGNFYLPWIRENGDLIIMDRNGLTIWNPASDAFKQLPLSRKAGPSKFTVPSDKSGNYFFEYDAGIWLLKPDNSVEVWSPASAFVKGLPTSMCIDRSGVLWAGTNGYGLRQYNLTKSGMPGYAYQHSFVIDVLNHYIVKPRLAATTFLDHSIPFANRIATWKDQIWIADVRHEMPEPQLALFSGQTLSVKTFRPDNAIAENKTHSIKFISYDKNGGLWGIDQQMHLLQFNTGKLTFTVYSRINVDPASEINGLVPDENNIFYLSSPSCLARFDASTGQTEILTNRLPSRDLLSLSNDPDDKSILWIGTLSDGLIQFNKSTRKTQVFSIATGLPNNTIYSIIPGSGQQLWCSSNKGIFAFNKNTGDIRSFTSRDGLMDDEFNRYNYLQLPDGNIAFGGSMGYTLFKPEVLPTDEFDPMIELTDLAVSSLPQLPAPVSQLTELRLDHQQNFITATFAAMQFDFPDKIQYRYQLAGFDKDWKMIGNQNKALYTSLPPGDYRLLMNASNTSGKWSSHVRSIHIVIAPPFWKTWWFYLFTGITLCGAIYIFLHARILRIKTEHARQLQFERKAMELHAMALRAQMNPHFIFNCLNSIKALIQEKENTNAIKYLTTFVSLIRKQLNNTSNQVALYDELETCRLYLEMEAMRFDGRFDFRFDIVDEELVKQLPVPPLTIQAVVENAVIHGLLPGEAGGRVDINVYCKDRHVYCEIKDNGIGRAAAAKLKEKSSPLHQSKGIHLLQERIALHNLIQEQGNSVETVDLYHANGYAMGTLVILKFKRL